MASNNHTHNINALGITVRNYQVSYLYNSSSIGLWIVLSKLFCISSINLQWEELGCFIQGFAFHLYCRGENDKFNETMPTYLAPQKVGEKKRF